MSFILEALKRADQERGGNQKPMLNSPRTESLPTRKRLWPWLIAASVLVINTAVLAWVFWPKAMPPVKEKRSGSESAQMALPPKKDAAADKGPSVRASVTAKTSDRRNESRPPSKKRTPKNKSERPYKTARDAKSPGQKAAEPMNALDSEEASEAASAAKPSSGHRRAGAGSFLRNFASAFSKGLPAKPEMPAAPPKAEEEPPAQTESAKSDVAVQKDGDKPVPVLRDLPLEIRKKLPEMAINIHAYDEDPEKRVVYINMQNYKVGDRIGEGGPLLAEIVPDGVIIDYGEGRARLEISR